jgi:hypothetical protein
MTRYETLLHNKYVYKNLLCKYTQGHNSVRVVVVNEAILGLAPGINFMNPHVVQTLYRQFFIPNSGQYSVQIGMYI